MPRARKARRSPGGKRPSRSAAGSRPDAGSAFLRAGLIAAVAVVPVTMDPLGFNLFGPSKAVVLSLASVLTLLGCALRPELVISTVRRLARSPLAIAAWVLLGLYALSTLTSVDASQSVLGGYPEYRGLLAFAYASLAGLAAATVATERGPDAALRTIASALAVSVAVVFGYALLQELRLDPISYRAGFDLGRARSTLGNASNLGVFLLLAAPLLLHRALGERGIKRAVLAALVAASALMLLWTSSRGAWVGLVVCAIVWLALEVPRQPAARRLRLGLGALGVVAACLVAVAVLAPSALTRALSTDVSSGTPRWRVVVWTSALHMAEDRPLLGWGPATFRFVYPRYRQADPEEVARSERVVADAHNVVADAAASAGFPAAVALLAVLGLAGAAGVRAARGKDGGWAIASFAAVAGGSTALMFHFATLDTAPLAAALVGLLASGTAPAFAAASGADDVPRRYVASGAAALAVSVSAVTIAAIGIVGADHMVARGFAGASKGALWADVSATFRSAERRAPWEPALVWAHGRAAIDSVRVRYDATARAEGEMALAEAAARLPLDVALTADRGDLALVSALKNSDRAVFALAETYYERCVDLDAFNASHWMGLGSARAGKGDLSGAANALRRALELDAESKDARRGLRTVEEAMRSRGDAVPVKTP